MRVHESGPETGETILFLHGAGASVEMWKAHVRHFARCHGLLPDFPGFGDAAGEPWVSLDQTTGEVAELVRTRAAGGRAHVVGVSLGGIVAIKLLAEAPELIDHAVVDGASVLPLRHLALAKLGLRLMRPIVKTDLVTGIIARRLALPEAGIADFRNDYRRMSAAAFVAAFTEALDFHQPQGLARVECPALFVAGEREPGSTLASNRLLARTMPQAAACIVPGKWHGWVAGEPLLHCRMVEAWITDRPLPAELATGDP
jgi:pimeloyl-ACP methyl ester carboxylesterase